jgi:hypothetical protein
VAFPNKYALCVAWLAGVTLREAGLATHYVPSSHMPQVEEALQGLGRTLQQEGRRGPWELGRVAQALDSAERAAGPLPQGGSPLVCHLLPLSVHTYPMTTSTSQMWPNGEGRCSACTCRLHS